MSPIHRSSHPHATTHSNNHPELGGIRPTTIGALVAAASVTTAAKFIGFALEVAAHDDIIPTKFGALLTVTIIVTWGALGTAAILNRIDRRTALIVDRIAEAVEEAGDRRATAATLAHLAEQHGAIPISQRRPHLVDS